MTPTELHEVDQVLLRTGAKLEGWQVSALYLGAQTSTNLRLGPQQLFETIFGPKPALGQTLEEVNATIGPLMKLWNRLVEDHRRGRVRLSNVPFVQPIDRGQIEHMAARRAEELLWFVRGIDAGGDDPADFGPEGEALLRELAGMRVLCDGYGQLIKGTTSAAAVVEAGERLTEVTRSIEGTIDRLMTVNDGVRRRLVAEARGQAQARSVKVGRNEPCPCGSGRKWKHCCGAV